MTSSTALGRVRWAAVASLRVDQGPSSLSKAKALGPKVFGVASFAVNLAVLVCQGGGLKAFATLGTAEAGLMPGLSGADHLLRSVDSLAAAGAALGAADLLGKLGCVGVGGGPVAGGLLMLDAQRLPLVGAQGACALPVAVAFGPVLLAVAGLAVDLLAVHGYGGAVQVLLTDHAQEAGFVEAVAFTLHLLGEVNRLLAHPTLLASSPVRHSGGGLGCAGGGRQAAGGRDRLILRLYGCRRWAALTELLPALCRGRDVSS